MREEIETVIDRLQAYVQKSGKTTVLNASKALGLPVKQVEKLALILEENNLMQVNYSLSGIVLSAKDDSQAPTKQKQEGNKILSESKALEHEVMTAETILAFLEQDLARRVNQAEAYFKDLESKQDFTKEELDFLRKEVDVILQQLAMFDEEIAKLSQKKGELLEATQKFKQRLSVLKEKPVTALKQTQAAELELNSQNLQNPRNLLMRLIALIQEFIQHLLSKKQAPVSPASLASPVAIPEPSAPSISNTLRAKPIKQAIAVTTSGKTTAEHHAEPHAETRAEIPAVPKSPELQKPFVPHPHKSHEHSVHKRKAMASVKTIKPNRVKRKHVRSKHVKLKKKLTNKPVAKKHLRKKTKK